MVTSSAVVGSSAISSVGRQTSAIAIITRWRKPPESWCGYCCEPALGAPMPTARSIAMLARSRRSVAQPAMQAQYLGDLEADGERRVEARHRLLEDHADAIAAHGAHRAVGERRQIFAIEQDAAGLRSPRGGDGISRMIDIAETLLPQPDSPTRPTVSPAPTAKRHILDARERTRPRCGTRRSGPRPKARGRSVAPRRAGLAHSKTTRGK